MPKHYRHWIEMKTLTQLRGVHSENLCKGEICVIHNPTEHHMRDWPMNWRGDRGLIERICPHGVGHPDPDQIPRWAAMGRITEGTHGCCQDGCCMPPEDEW